MNSDVVNEEAPNPLDGRHFSTQHLFRQFRFGHLPQHLQLVSMPCANLALSMIKNLEDGPELTVGLRKLLEAKDAFVRQAVEDQIPSAEIN